MADQKTIVWRLDILKKHATHLQRALVALTVRRDRMRRAFERALVEIQKLDEDSSLRNAFERHPLVSTLPRLEQSVQVNQAIHVMDQGQRDDFPDN